MRSKKAVLNGALISDGSYRSNMVFMFQLMFY